MNGIDVIQHALNLPAFLFAQTKVDSCEIGGIEYMRDLFGSGNKKFDNIKDEMDDLKNYAFSQYLNEYAKCATVFAGFIENGRVYVLDKTHKCVFALYSAKDGGAHLYMHYNPTGYDCIEQVSNIQYVFGEVENEIFELSQDESEIIKECDKL